MMAGIQTAKTDLRRRMRDVLQQLPADSIVSQSRIVANRLFALPEYQRAKRIGIYLSMPSGELSTSTIVQDALKNGKEVFVPYIHTVEIPSTHQKVSVMDMLTLESMEEFTSLTPDKWGIPSLTKARALKKKNCFGRVGISGAESDEVSGDSSGLDMILMPGMAFDPQFRRLGHGKGYYDSFLAKYSKWDTQTQRTLAEMPLLVALSLKEQTLSPPEEIPVTSHDWPVDVLIVGDDQCFVRQR